MENNSSSNNKPNGELNKTKRMLNFQKMSDIAGLTPTELRAKLIEDLGSPCISQSSSKYVHEITVVPTTTAVTFSVASTSAGRSATTWWRNFFIGQRATYGQQLDGNQQT